MGNGTGTRSQRAEAEAAENEFRESVAVAQAQSEANLKATVRSSRIAVIAAIIAADASIVSAIVRQRRREQVAGLARLPSVPSGLAKRARIVLLAADGNPNSQIARTAGVSRPTVTS